MAKKKYYAVRNGRYGPDIYMNWNDCLRSTHSWSNAEFKGFSTMEDAQRWLEQSNCTYRTAEAAFQAKIRSAAATRNESDLDRFQYYDSSQEEVLNEQQHSTEGSAEPTPTSEVALPWSRSIQKLPEPFMEDFIPLPGGHNYCQNAEQRPTITLSQKQIEIYNEVMQGKNVFFTGSAGTGKSVLLRQIITDLKDRNSLAVAVTASTGIAAVNIGGVTLHSWAGIGLGIGTFDKLKAEIFNNRTVLKRWRETKTLIIDEISMIDGVLFDKLEQLGRAFCNHSEPFGGIQVVLSGDFCQLPPVPGRDCRHPSFAFESKGWRQCFNERDDHGCIHRLTKVFRQSDQTFIDMLNALRKGKPDTDTISRFLQLARPLVYDDGLGPCELFPLREQVYEANNSRLRDLPGESRLYHAKDVGGYDAQHRPVSTQSATNLLNRFSLAPDTMILKTGAQIMLIKNLSQGLLVNGTMGQIIDFKSLKEARESGFSIATLKSKETREDVINELVREYGEVGVWPLVRFLNGTSMLLAPVRFEVLNVLGGIEASRHQVPLILAWALSIHKSQGQSLERVKVDLGRIFENGQAYVALSRATCLEGLEVQNFLPSRIMAHPRVLTFYEQLEARAERSESGLLELEDSHGDGIIQPDSEEFDEFDDLPNDEATRLYLLAVSNGLLI